MNTSECISDVTMGRNVTAFSARDSIHVSVVPSPGSSSSLRYLKVCRELCATFNMTARGERAEMENPGENVKH